MFCIISLPCLVLNLRGASSDLTNLPVTTGILTRRNQKKPEGWKLRSVRPSFPACEVRTSPWAPQEQFMTKIGQAAQSTGWIISSQSRDQAVQSTGWIISVQSQFFRSCFLRTSPWGCWGPLTYRWWSGSGSTLGSCPAVSWGSSEPTMYEFSRDGGMQTKQANQVAWKNYFRPCSAETIYFSPCSAEMSAYSSYCAEMSYSRPCCAEMSAFSPCSRLRCPCPIPCRPYSSPSRTRRTFTRSSCRRRMLPRRTWRTLPRRSWRRRRREPR